MMRAWCEVIIGDAGLVCDGSVIGVFCEVSV